MTPKTSTGPARHRGIASVLAVVLLVVFVTLGAAMFAVSDMGLLVSENLNDRAEARLAAESGLAFMVSSLHKIRLPLSTDADNFPANLSDCLGDLLDGTANLDGQTVAATADGAAVPTIALNDGRAFTAQIAWVDATCCHMTIEGTAGNATHAVSIDLAMEARNPLVFDYGLASRGELLIGGSVEVAGVDWPGEAHVFSADTSAQYPITVEGSGAYVSGDLYVTQGDGAISIGGQPTIGGTSDPAEIADHLHYDAHPPDFPELDTAPLEALATTVVDASTDTSQQGQTYNNIRIAAGTNPTFANDTLVNGIVYVEAPNVVSFEGSCTLNGMVVTENNDLPLEDCRLRFAGTATVSGVEALPDTAEFADVRQHTGTFLLAPGFEAVFEGNLQTINGAIAADRLAFGGNASGRINGSVVGLADLPSEIKGSVSIRIDRTTSEADHAGFQKSIALEPVADTYCEPTPTAQ
ncbi:MAG: hypothetical protein KGY99_08795 [Phycisphaerae bacterium]|nr:hypothetical protein [Phycisphaerae bacterium]